MHRLAKRIDSMGRTGGGSPQGVKEMSLNLRLNDIVELKEWIRANGCVVIERRNFRTSVEVCGCDGTPRFAEDWSKLQGLDHDTSGAGPAAGGSGRLLLSIPQVHRREEMRCNARPLD